jgi:di/tricarboxylate transporter
MEMDMSKLLTVLSGWKTLIVFLGVIVDSLLNNSQAIQFLSEMFNLSGEQLAAIAAILLRFLTTTPIGGSKE